MTSRPSAIRISSGPRARSGSSAVGCGRSQYRSASAASTVRVLADAIDGRPGERRIGEFFKRKTLMFNGYADEVASLYAGMDLRKLY